MNINDLTIGEAKKLAQMFAAEGQSAQQHIGDMCIVRTYASGVHFGTVIHQNGREVMLEYARRLWRWDVAPHGVSLSELSIHGPVGKRSKICEAVPVITLLDALEIIPCSEKCAQTINGAQVYKP